MRRFAVLFFSMLVPLISQAGSSSRTYTISCATCEDIASLNAEGSSFAGAGAGTAGKPNAGDLSNKAIVLVTGETAPISAYLRFYNRCPSHGTCTNSNIVRVVEALATDNMNAADLDNRLFARAAKIKAIDLPASYGIAGAHDEELVEAYVNTILQLVPGSTGISVWHGITNFPAFSWFGFIDLRFAVTQQIFVNDVITLVFSDGSSIQVKFLGIGVPDGLFFQVVEGSARDAAGKPLGTTSVGAPSGTDARWGTTRPAREGAAWASLPYSLCYTRSGTVCTSDPSQLCANYRSFLAPC